jgi:hypothetical protein
MEELTEAQKAKARRAQAILYAVMVAFVLGPLVLFWIFRKR